jgi:hypothetical protein
VMKLLLEISAVRRLGLLGLAALAGCPSAPPEPVKPAPLTTDAAAEAAPAASGEASDAGQAPETGAAWLLPDGGKLQDVIGWDLDPADPARDYVRRYATATKRYGELVECVSFGKSVRQGTKSKVEVREAPSPKCKTGTAVRDVFLVDVAGDRLTVDDPAAWAPLTVWPDESKPDEKAAPVVSINRVREWTTPMKDMFELLRLSVIRIQGYGRGSYLVITLSGWHTPLAHDAPEAKLKEALKKLCDANDGHSFAVASQMEGPVWLRENCAAGTYKWDKSPVWVAPN